MVCVMHAEVDRQGLAGARAIYDPELVKFSGVWIRLQPTLAELVLPLCRVAVSGMAGLAAVEPAAAQLAALASRWCRGLTFGDYKRFVVAPHLRTWKERLAATGVATRSFVKSTVGGGRGSAASTTASATAVSCDSAEEAESGDSDADSAGILEAETMLDDD